MKTGMSLLLIGVGAIFAFAVTTNTADFNLHTAGYVIILVGIAGIAIPRRNSDWISGRRLVRRVRSWPGGRLQEESYPPYVTRNPGDNRVRAGLPPTPSVRTDREAAEKGDVAVSDAIAGDTEVIEDIYEQQ